MSDSWDYYSLYIKTTITYYNHMIFIFYTVLVRLWKRQARELLAAVRAEKLETRSMGALSGGELQWVLLALALQEEPDLLVLDEPTAGVDFQGEQLFCKLLDDLRNERGFTQLMVTHDLTTVTHHATHTICLNRRVQDCARTATGGTVILVTFGWFLFSPFINLFSKERSS